MQTWVEIVAWRSSCHVGRGLGTADEAEAARADLVRVLLENKPTDAVLAEARRLLSTV